MAADTQPANTDSLRSREDEKSRPSIGNQETCEPDGWMGQQRQGQAGQHTSGQGNPLCLRTKARAHNSSKNSSSIGSSNRIGDGDGGGGGGGNRCPTRRAATEATGQIKSASCGCL